MVTVVITKKEESAHIVDTEEAKRCVNTPGRKKLDLGLERDKTNNF